jgi:fucose permease
VARLKGKSTEGLDIAPSDAQPEPAGSRRSSAVNAAKSILDPLKIPGVRPVLIVFFLYCGIEWMVGLWGATFLIRVKGVDVSTAAGWVSLYYGSITFGRFISGFVSMRLSSKAIIRSGEIAILMGGVLLLLPLPDIFSLVAFMLIGLGCAPIFPSMLHETPARFGDAEAQNIMGFQMAVAYIGTTVLPPLFGAIADVTTFELFPFVILAFIALMLVNSERVNRLVVARRQQLSAVQA